MFMFDYTCKDFADDFTPKAQDTFAFTAIKTKNPLWGLGALNSAEPIIHTGLEWLCEGTIGTLELMHRAVEIQAQLDPGDEFEIFY